MDFLDGVRCFTRKFDNFVQGDRVKHNLGRENYAVQPIARRPVNLSISGLHFMPSLGSSVFLVQINLVLSILAVAECLPRALAIVAKNQKLAFWSLPLHFYSQGL